MLSKTRPAIALPACVGLAAACFDSREANTETGISGAAAGQAFAEGPARGAATPVGAAIGTLMGATRPRSGTCVYRKNRTGETFRETLV